MDKQAIGIIAALSIVVVIMGVALMMSSKPATPEPVAEVTPPPSLEMPVAEPPAPVAPPAEVTPPAPMVEVMEPLTGSGAYTVDTSASLLHWSSKKPLIPGYMDLGTIKVKDGSVTVKDGDMTAGTFTIDMNSIITEKTGMGKGETMMADHIKSEDFFNVTKYPTSTFSIKSVTKDPSAGENHYTLSGSLTMKGIKKPISFPAVVYANSGMLRAKGTVTIDRTIWGIKYASGQFFKDLGDKMIDDMFTVDLDLTATLPGMTATTPAMAPAAGGQAAPTGMQQPTSMPPQGGYGTNPTQQAPSAPSGVGTMPYGNTGTQQAPNAMPPTGGYGNYQK